jgi:hypothetical protein
MVARPGSTSFVCSEAVKAVVTTSTLSRSSTTSSNRCTFTYLSNTAGPNQTVLNGINDVGVIAGYHSYALSLSKGFILEPPYRQSNYISVNYPGALLSRVQAINKQGQVAGYWLDAANFNYGFL